MVTKADSNLSDRAVVQYALREAEEKALAGGAAEGPFSPIDCSNSLLKETEGRKKFDLNVQAKSQPLVGGLNRQEGQQFSSWITHDKSKTVIIENFYKEPAAELEGNVSAVEVCSHGAGAPFEIRDQLHANGLEFDNIYRQADPDHQRALIATSTQESMPGGTLDLNGKNSDVVMKTEHLKDPSGKAIMDVSEQAYYDHDTHRLLNVQVELAKPKS